MDRAAALGVSRRSVPAALIGRVTPNLVSVTAGVDGEIIRIVFYYDGAPTDDDFATAHAVTTAVAGALPAGEGWRVEGVLNNVREEPERWLDLALFKRRPQTPYE